MTNYIDLLTDLLNDYDARGDRDPFEIVAEYAERIDDAKTYTFTFTSDQIADALTRPYGDRPSPLRGLADDPAAIKHIADRILGFANGSFEDDVYEAAYDYLDNVVDQYPTY